MNATALVTTALHQFGTRTPSTAATPSRNTPNNSPAAQKLRKAASEFESLLLANWWSTMKDGGLSGGEDGTDPGKDTLDHLGTQAMSAAVANGGGLGIGAMLVRSLLSNVEPAPPNAPGSGPGSGPGSTPAAKAPGVNATQSRV